MAAVEEAFARFSSTASSTSDLPTKTYYVNSIDGLSRGKKYFVSGWCSGRILNMFVDSGAEISCIPRRCVPHETLIPLERPVQVAGFRDKDAVKVTHLLSTRRFEGQFLCGRYAISHHWHGSVVRQVEKDFFSDWARGF